MRWPTVALAEVADVIRGVTFASSEASDAAQPGHVPVLRAGNIAEQLRLDDDLVFVPDGRINPKQMLRVNDIVVCTSSGSASVLGKSAVLEREWAGAFGAFLTTVRCDERQVDPRFVAHFLRAPEFRTWASDSSGVGIKNIRSSELKDYAIPLPPLEEQRRIAAILDQADALRRLRARALTRLDALGQAIFQEMFGDVRLEADRWELVGFSGACSDETKLSEKVLRRDYLDAGELPVVDQGQSLVAGWVDDDDVECRSELPVVVFGDHTRAVKFVDFPFAIGADGAKVLKPSADFDPAFFAALLANMPIPELGYSRHMRELKTMRFPRPPISLQREFSDRWKAIRAMKAGQAEDVRQLNSLFASLQHRAFRGEL